MDNEMIERVATAITERRTGRNYNSIELAIAAIKAMREPTKKIIDAGLRATAVHLNIKGSQLTVNRGKMEARFNAMIDSIITDETYGSNSNPIIEADL